MAERREETSSELKDIQIGCSWIPTTPAKPNSTKQQPICTEWQENNLLQPNHFTQTNLSGSEILTSTGVESLQTQQRQTSAACNSPAHVSTLETSQSHASWDYLSEFDTWQASKSASSSHVYGEDKLLFPVQDMDDKWPTMSFSNLLALADSAGNKGAAHNVPTPSTYTSLFHPQMEGSQFIINFGDPSLQDQDSLGAKYDTPLNIPEVMMDGRRPSFNLNAPPRSNTAAALSKSTSSQFAPITPQKTSNAEYRQESSLKDLSVDQMPAQKDAQENKTTTCGAMELRKRKEKSHLVIEQLYDEDDTSTQLQENYKPDKEGMDEADLIKTPPPKARKKKHRPKVIIEGKKQRTPKSSAVKPTVQQDTSTPKRKYVRRKRVENPLEEGTSGEKRKYERKKRTDEADGDMDVGPTDTAEENVSRYTRSSCRRSLNFNSDSQVIDESSSYCPPSNCNSDSQAENFDAKKDQSRNTELMMEKNDVDTSQQQHSPRFADQIVSTRGKCQIVFSDFTHDKEVDTVQVRMNSPDGRITQKSQSDSKSSSTCLTTETQVIGLKRKDAAVESELCNRNENGAFYNSLQAHLPVYSQNTDHTDGSPVFHFQTIYKKKRTEKVHNNVVSSDNNLGHERHDRRVSWPELFASTTNQGSSGAQCQVANLKMINFGADCNQNGRQIFKDLLDLGPKERIKRRRSKGVTRVRNLSSLLEIRQELPASSSRVSRDIENLNEPYTCMEALVADTHSKMAKKKRSKRNMLMSSTQNSYSNQKISMGPQLALTWKPMSSVDSLVEQLNQLDLNAERCRPSRQEQDQFIAYHRDYQLQQHALVPFQRYGDVVPYDNSFDQVRRRRPRPKVELDDETTRVWKLLLENINSEGIDGTDEEKTKWWEEERRMFNGRADSFIARMHLVQGDRRFSPWKGSVVDSVVGVFLTQNVSDHLSSSAFMSLAARFPLVSNTQHAEIHEEELGTKMKEPEVCELDSNGNFGLEKDILNESAGGEVTKILQDFKDDSIRDVNSGKSVGDSFDGFISKDNFSSQSTDTSKDCPVTSHETVANKMTSSNGDEKDTEDSLSSQNSANSPIAQTTERSDPCLVSTSEEGPTAGVTADRFTSSTSFVKLLQMAGSVLHGDYEKGCDKKMTGENQRVQSESLTLNFETARHLYTPTFPSNTSASCSKSTMSDKLSEFDLSQKNSQLVNSSGEKDLCAAEISELSSESASIPSPNAHSSSIDHIEINQNIAGSQTGQENTCKMQEVSRTPNHAQNLMDVTGSTSNINYSKKSDSREVSSNKNDPDYHLGKMVNGRKAKGGRPRKEKENQIEWDLLRKQTKVDGVEKERTANRMDSVDWDAVRCADVNEIAETIKERGMNNMLAERIKEFLNRIVRDHGSIDLEWLRDVPPDKAKEYLLSFRGLGLKSVECVRLLTLHHLAFPVDTNVGRIAVRLGWVPLQPLPESLQLHLLELYPVLESIQKYLWPRLCKLDQPTLYELHYQMITFGKVFCTKSKPNCNACPMRAECRHFASAFASARLALPAPEEKSIVGAIVNRTADQNPTSSSMNILNTLRLPSPQDNQMVAKAGVSNSQPIIEEPASPEPTVEVPATPEPECDIEDALDEDPDEIPTIKLNMEEFTHNLHKIMQQNTQLQEGDMSKALVALTAEAASIPVPKLKNMSRLRTEHQVYELPDSHPLLNGMDKRETDDPSPYLLAIWTPGETIDSIAPPERRCKSEGFEKLCTDETCSSCNSIREANSQTVRGTLLIPCRTAMRGSFPLNGTYFQVNEVFSDHESSLTPMNIPRKWLWNLPRRTVYFGTSIPTIFKGLSTEGIQYCFWRGFVCVRGFDRKTRAPRPLIARLHFPASKLSKGKGKMDE